MLDNDKTAGQLPDALQYLNPEQVAHVEEFWTRQAELGQRQRWNVQALLMILAGALVTMAYAGELGEREPLFRKIMFSGATIGVFVAGIAVIVNRGMSTALERVISRLNLRAAETEYVIELGRAVKHVKFLPFGEQYFRWRSKK